jgi:hypothetical protein
MPPKDEMDEKEREEKIKQAMSYKGKVSAKKKKASYPMRGGKANALISAVGGRAIGELIKKQKGGEMLK